MMKRIIKSFKFIYWLLMSFTFCAAYFSMKKRERELSELNSYPADEREER